MLGFFMSNVIVPQRTVLTEPFAIADTFVTGLETPAVFPEFARLVFWTDHQSDPGEALVERQIAAKLVMPINTYRMMRRLIARASDGG